MSTIASPENKPGCIALTRARGRIPRSLLRAWLLSFPHPHFLPVTLWRFHFVLFPTKEIKCMRPSQLVPLKMGKLHPSQQCESSEVSVPCGLAGRRRRTQVFSLPPTALSTNTQPPGLSKSFHHTPRGATRALLNAPLLFLLLRAFTQHVGNSLNVCVFPKLTKKKNPPNLSAVAKRLRLGFMS